jgi:hypothetical protein
MGKRRQFTAANCLLFHTTPKKIVIPNEIPIYRDEMRNLLEIFADCIK